MSAGISLRDVSRSDVESFFNQQRDEVAKRQAAFTPSAVECWPDFQEHWEKILSDPEIVKRAIVVEGEPVGNVVCFPWNGHIEIGYWVDRKYWGRGIATAAVKGFLRTWARRPLYASVAADNRGSIRVLEKNGFKLVGRSLAYSNARQSNVDELIFRLEHEAADPDQRVR